MIEVVCSGRAERPHNLRPIARLVDGRTEPFGDLARQRAHAELVARVLPDAAPVEPVEQRFGVALGKLTVPGGGRQWPLVEAERTAEGHLRYTLECDVAKCKRHPAAGRRRVVLSQQHLEELLDDVQRLLPPKEGSGTWRIDLGFIERWMLRP